MSTFSTMRRVTKHRGEAKVLAAGGVILQALKKDGTPSKMAGSATVHADERAARAEAWRIRCLNTQPLRFSVNGKEV